MIWPVMPKSADALRAQLGLPASRARGRAASAGRSRSPHGKPARRWASRRRSSRRIDPDQEKSPRGRPRSRVARGREPRRPRAPVAGARRRAADGCHRLRRFREARSPGRRGGERRAGGGQGQAPVAARSTSASPSRARSSPGSRCRSAPKTWSGSAWSWSATSSRASSARIWSRTACCSRRGRAKALKLVTVDADTPRRVEGEVERPNYVAAWQLRRLSSA